MYIAIGKNRQRYTADEGGECFCPSCYEKVIPVLGDVYTHHWRHQKDSKCTWGCGETEWHLRMKSAFPSEYLEVAHGRFRSDVLLPNGTSIEFQYSAISNSDVTDRTNSVRRCIWAFNVEPQFSRGQLTISNNGLFKYRKPKDSFAMLSGDLYLYFNDGLIAHPTNWLERYEHNVSIGYNQRVATGSANIYTIEGFRNRIMTLDSKLQPLTATAPVSQGCLFNLPYDHD